MTEERKRLIDVINGDHELFKKASVTVYSFVKFIDRLIDNGVTVKSEEQAEWIPVERELPVPFVSVLVYMPGERPCPTVHEGFLTNDGTWYAGCFTREADEVVAWRPMPEPPSDEEVPE